MKRTTAFFFILCLFSIPSKTFSQLPDPVSSPVIDALIGTWISDPYEFMGNKSTNTVTYTKILNGQYIEMDVKRVSDNGFIYSAKEIITPSQGGTMVGSYYDVFAKGPYTTNYSGTSKGGKVTINAVGGTGSGEIIIDGNIMTENVMFKMSGMPGAPVENISLRYTKQ